MGSLGTVNSRDITDDMELDLCPNIIRQLVLVNLVLIL